MHAARQQQPKISRDFFANHGLPDQSSAILFPSSSPNRPSSDPSSCTTPPPFATSPASVVGSSRISSSSSSSESIILACDKTFRFLLRGLSSPDNAVDSSMSSSS